MKNIESNITGQNIIFCKNKKVQQKNIPKNLKFVIKKLIPKFGKILKTLWFNKAIN